jgi:hypothetical protein
MTRCARSERAADTDILPTAIVGRVPVPSTRRSKMHAVRVIPCDNRTGPAGRCVRRWPCAYRLWGLCGVRRPRFFRLLIPGRSRMMNRRPPAVPRAPEGGSHASSPRRCASDSHRCRVRLCCASGHGDGRSAGHTELRGHHVQRRGPCIAAGRGRAGRRRIRPGRAWRRTRPRWRNPGASGRSGSRH